MVKLGRTQIAKEKFYAPKTPIKFWMLILIIQLKSVKTKTNSWYFIGCLDKDIRPLVLIRPKICGYDKAFKGEGKINKLISFYINDEKLLEKYKAISTKIENLKNIKLNASLVYNDRYMKTKIRTNDNKIYTNFCELNVPEDDTCESFTVISIDSLLVYENRFYLRIYLENCAYKL